MILLDQRQLSLGRTAWVVAFCWFRGMACVDLLGVWAGRGKLHPPIVTSRHSRSIFHTFHIVLTPAPPPLKNIDVPPLKLTVTQNYI
jgi:hypothetical protein